jgi:hypothetical protein
VYGSPEQRPIVSGTVGLLLLVPGAVFARHMYLLVTEGVSANLRYEAAMLTIAMLGTWLLFQAGFRKRFYLRITTKVGVRKLVFASVASLAEVRAFLEDARVKYGFQVNDEVHRA